LAGGNEVGINGVKRLDVMGCCPNNTGLDVVSVGGCGDVKGLDVVSVGGCGDVKGLDVVSVGGCGEASGKVIEVSSFGLSSSFSLEIISSFDLSLSFDFVSSSLDFVLSFDLSSVLVLSSDLSSFLGLESNFFSLGLSPSDSAPNDWLIYSEEVNAIDNIEDKSDKIRNKVIVCFFTINAMNSHLYQVYHLWFIFYL
jgi:hypothetical protein